MDLSYAQVIWLSPACGEGHEQKAEWLRAEGFTLTFASNLKALHKKLHLDKYYIVLISDNFAIDDFHTQLSAIFSWPASEKVIFLFSIEQHSQALLELAAGFPFYDFLLFSLPKTEWLKRIPLIGKPSQAIANPLGAIEINEDINIKIPTKLIWLTKDLLGIESNLQLVVDSYVHFSHPIFAARGIESIKIKVLKILPSQNDHRLDYEITAKPLLTFQDRESIYTFAIEKLTSNKGSKLVDRDILQIPRSHELAISWLNLAGHLHLLQPDILECTMSFSCKNYTLMQIEAKVFDNWLQCKPWVRLISSSPKMGDKGSNSYIWQCSFASLIPNDKQKLLQGVGLLFLRRLNHKEGIDELTQVEIISDDIALKQNYEDYIITSIDKIEDKTVKQILYQEPLLIFTIFLLSSLTLVLFKVF